MLLINVLSEEEYYKELKKCLLKDLNFGYIIKGVYRDDFGILIDGKLVIDFVFEG